VDFVGNFQFSVMTVGLALPVRNNLFAVTGTLPQNLDFSPKIDLDTYKSTMNDTQKIAIRCLHFSHRSVGFLY
jgi:hypothetical protein